MNTITRTLLGALLIALLVSSAWAEDFDYRMQSTDGKQHALNEYIGKGKWTIVNVWSAQCPYCRHELPDVSEFHDEHVEKDAMIVGLTIHLPDYGMPDKTLLKEFADSYIVEFPLLLADDQIVKQVIDKPFNGVPVFYIYNPQGEFVKQINGMVTKADLEAAIQ